MGDNSAVQMSKEQLAKIAAFLAPYQSALNLPKLSEIISGGGAGGAVLPLTTATGMARNEAATAGLNEAETAARAANQRMGPGTSYSALPGNPNAAFQDQIARNVASAGNEAALNQQNLQLQNFQSAIQPLTSIINTLFGGYSQTGSAGINNANYNWLTGSGGAIPALGSVARASYSIPSDRRLKSNIEKIGKFGPLNVYEYDIDGRREVGVMAQEARVRFPEAVHSDLRSLRVNYNKLRELVHA